MVVGGIRKVWGEELGCSFRWIGLWGRGLEVMEIFGGK